MPAKGPAVFLDYDQAALDAAYDHAAYAPTREQLIQRRIRDSELARGRLGEPARVAYGSAEIERLDIYRTGREAASVFVFIHGGAWRSGRSKDFAVPAEMFLAAGAHYVVPDFAWVQEVGGSLMVLAGQVRRAVAWVYDNAAYLGGDPNRLYIGGQSSGGHLIAGDSRQPIRSPGTGRARPDGLESGTRAMPRIHLRSDTVTARSPPGYGCNWPLMQRTDERRSVRCIAICWRQQGR